MLAAASGSLATTFARVTSASRHLTAMHNHVTALASVVTALSNAAFGAERAVRAGEGAPAGGSDAVERREIAAVHTKISGGDTHRPSVQCEKCGDRRVRCADSSLGICRCAAGVFGYVEPSNAPLAPALGGSSPSTCVNPRTAFWPMPARPQRHASVIPTAFLGAIGLRLTAEVKILGLRLMADRLRLAALGWQLTAWLTANGSADS